MEDPYVAFCVDEAVFTFGRTIESELAKLKKGKTEKEETFAARKHREFLRLLDQQDQIKFASPM